MRNLKRALSLALASVMLLGMMVVGSSAASFPDVDDNDNIEAIDVLNAVGVMLGDADTGNFRPNDKVSRNEMAVIMAKLILGGYEADSYVGSHPFTDVPSWADRYVAACYINGIIAGRGEGIYDGGATVTAVEAAAMMLRALGYEDLSKGAAQWDQPVAAKANQIALFKGLTGNSKAELSRNDVAKLALNTLQATMVTTEKEGDIEIPGTITIPGKITYTEVTSGDDFAATINDVKGADNIRCTVELGEKLYNGDLVLNKNAGDDFGRSIHRWSYKAREVNTSVNDPDAVYTKEVKLSNIFKDLGLSSPVDSSKVHFYHNGRGEGAGITDNSTTPVALSGLRLARDVDNKIGGNGVLIQVWYDTKDREATVTIINTFVAQVTSYNTSKKELTLKDVTGAVALTSVVTDSKKLTLSSSDFDGLDAFAKDDYVLVTVARGEIQTIKGAEVINGDVDSYVADKNVTVDGKTYSYTKGYEGPSDNYKLNSAFDLYVDDYGYVIFAKGTEAGEDYLYVTKSASTSGVNGGYEIKFIGIDGTETIGLVHDDSTGANGTTTEGIAKDGSGNITGVTTKRWYKYEMKGGKYLLTGLTTAKDSTDLCAAGTANAGDEIVNTNKTSVLYNNGTDPVRANNGTIFLVKKGDNITVYTGVNNVPDVKVAAGGTATVSVIMDKDNTNFAKYVMIDAVSSALSTSGSVAGERIFIIDATNKKISETGDNKKLYTYEAVRTGEVEEIISTSNSWAVGLYKDVAYDGDYVDTMIPVEDDSDDTLKRHDAYHDNIDLVNGALSIGGDILADDCKVFITDGDELTETTPSGLDAKYSDREPLTGYIYTVLDNKRVVEVYVVEDETRPVPGSEDDPTVQAFEVTEAKDQTFTLTGKIVSGTPDEAKGAFTDAHMANLGKPYFVAAVTLPGTKAVHDANKDGSDIDGRYAIRVTSKANDPDEWTSFPWGASGTNDVTLYNGVKRFRSSADYESGGLAVLMLPGTTATIEVMFNAGGSTIAKDGTLQWNDAEKAGYFDDNFKADYTLTIDASGLTTIAP